ATLLIGLGTGPTLPLYTLLVQNASPPNQLGVVTSGSIFARSVGQVIGLALFGTLFAATLTGSLQKRTSEVMQGLSGEIQPVVAAAIPDISAGGEGTAIAFEGEAVRAQIVGASGLSASDRESALTAVAQIEEAF